ncbi:MAG TPA: NAD-dependent epimerase/dehydratase family protein, partial [Longimicrobium sp.]|nr:NAD-dependent epimerase/dehydratase family protein [Longimicrobium sp.]
MKIFIAGATGVLGRRMVAELAGRGHEVVGMARGEEKAALVRSLGGVPAQVSLFDADALARAADGAEVVVHAATAIPTGMEARSPKAWEANDRIRRDGTRALTEAAARVGARRYLQQSVAWVVRTAPGGPFYDESTPPDPPAPLVSAIDGERIALEAGAKHGFEAAVLRGGMFYGADTAHNRMMTELLLKRRLPILGRGDYLTAPIHADDVAGAFVLAAEAPRVTGTWHVVDDEPVTAAALFRRLAEAVGAPEPRRLPLWIAKLLLGRVVVEAMTVSMNTSNAKLRRELGWVPRYPTYREGIAQMVAAWREEGFLP